MREFPPHTHTHTPRGGGRPGPRVAEESPEACGEQVGMGSPACEVLLLGTSVLLTAPAFGGVPRCGAVAYLGQ